MRYKITSKTSDAKLLSIAQEGTITLMRERPTPTGDIDEPVLVLGDPYNTMQKYRDSGVAFVVTTSLAQ